MGDGRAGRELDIGNTIETEEGEEKAIEGAIQETNVQEISRFNNYIDAIYKRMNAALRAKLMDPMVLNLEAKDKQEKQEKDKKEKSDMKRVKMMLTVNWNVGLVSRNPSKRAIRRRKRKR